MFKQQTQSSLQATVSIFLTSLLGCFSELPFFVGVGGTLLTNAANGENTDRYSDYRLTILATFQEIQPWT